MNYFDNAKLEQFFNELTEIIAEIQEQENPEKNISVNDLASKYEIPLELLPEETRLKLEPYLNENLYNPGGSSMAAKGCVLCLGCIACLFCAEINVGAGITSLVGILTLAPSPE